MGLDKVSISQRSIDTAKGASGPGGAAKAERGAATKEKKSEASTGVSTLPDPALETPDYVVSISAEKTDKKSTYSPQEVKAKAKWLLASGTLSGKEQGVLGEILSKESEKESKP